MKLTVNLTRFQKVFYHFVKFLGLSPFTVLNNNEIRPVTFLGKVYSLILIVPTALWLWCLDRTRASDVSLDSSSHIVFRILILLFGASTVSTLYVFAFRGGEMISVIDRTVRAEDALASLGVDSDRGKYSVAKIISTTVLVLVLKIRDFVESPADHMDGAWSRFLWVGCIPLLIHNNILILIFVQTMIRIRKCFESLNEKLGDVTRPAAHVRSHSVFVVKRKGEDDGEDDVRNSLESIDKMRKLHHELSGLTDSTINFFTLPIMLNIGYLFCNSLVCSYTAYRNLNSLTDGTTSLVSSFLDWVPTAVVIMMHSMLIAHACSSTCNAVRKSSRWGSYGGSTLQSEREK